MFSRQGIIDEDALNIFTDGSSYPNKKRAAGVGVLLVWVNEQGDEELSGYAPTGWQSASIDEMEIQACIVGLKEAQYAFDDLKQFKKIILFTDSLYVHDNFIKAMKVWPNRKWQGSNGMPVKNIDLWKKLRKEYKSIQIRIEIQWVKAHKKNLHNKSADKLAKESASMPFNKPLSITETTKKWSNNSTKRGSIKIFGQETKIRIISREFIAKPDTYEYRYEVIDSEDKSFKELDFTFYNGYLSRNKCLHVRFNDQQKKPFIEAVISELDCSEYNY